jgi:glycosyltransferase involved in cell wall biosynthesis
VNSLKHNVTIAIPVFNEEDYLEETVHSAVAQGCLVSVIDNASTDRTAEIGAGLTRKFENVKYFCHSANIGAINNYRFALETAHTEYFMWLGGHDLIERGYVASLLTAIESEQDALLAFPSSQNIDRTGKSLDIYQCEFAESLQDPRPLARVSALIRWLSDCSMLHGLFRRQPILDCWYEEACIGFDHVLLCRIAAKGKLLFVDGPRYLRRHPRTEDSLEDQLERISPHARGLQPLIYDQMCRAQLEVMKAGASGLIGIGKARFHLIRRFGLFRGATLSEDLMNRAIATAFSGAKIMRNVARRGLSPA